MKLMLDLFVSFAKIGLFTFGGGYAMMPLIQREIVNNKHWATDEEITDYYALSQCTPGAIAINTATFVGNKVGGKWGGIWASLGVVFPSFVIISVIAAFITNFAHLSVVKHAFAGIRLAVSALIINTVITLFKKNLKKALDYSIFGVVLVLSFFFDISPVYLAVGAILLGILVVREANK